MAGRSSPKRSCRIAQPLIARDRRPARGLAGRAPRRAARRSRRPFEGRSREGPGGSGRRARRVRASDRVPSEDSAPRLNPPPSEPPRLTASVLRTNSLAGAPSTAANTANPSRSLIAATTTPGACANPWFQPWGVPCRKGRPSPPANGWVNHCPASLAGLVLPVQDALAVERRNAVDDAHGVVGHLPLGAGGPVPTVHLIDAALGALVDDAIGRRRRPVGHEHGWSAESRLPARVPFVGHPGTLPGRVQGGPARARERAADPDGARRRGRARRPPRSGSPASTRSWRTRRSPWPPAGSPASASRCRAVSNQGNSAAEGIR